MSELALRLKEAHRLCDQRREADAWVIAQECVLADPHNIDALLLATHLLDRLGRWAEGYAMAKLAVASRPDLPGAWMNVGRMAEALYQNGESENAHRRAIDLARNKAERALALTNLSALYVKNGRWQQAKAKALEALGDAESRKARYNLSLARLALGEWTDGWRDYRAMEGSHLRREVRYAGEPRWDGSPGRSIVVTGEQGLGDEIGFASMLPDVIRDSARVVVECDKRLEGLFKRSFPQAVVYGTRHDKAANWPVEDRRPEASICAGGLGEYYRPRPESCPGEAYLVACPARRTQWRALFDKAQRPVIGIAWTGGAWHTGGKWRHWVLDDLYPLFRAIDATWVSLQYRDAAQEIASFKQRTGIEVKQFPWATLTADYDDVAAMVAELDLVVSMQTAVVHLAGGLGVPVWAFVHHGGQWRYGATGESCPWYRSMRVLRQTESHEWSPLIEQAADDLTERFGANLDWLRPKIVSGNGGVAAQHSAAVEKAGVDCVSVAVATAGVQAAARSAAID